MAKWVYLLDFASTVWKDSPQHPEGDGKVKLSLTFASSVWKDTPQHPEGDGKVSLSFRFRLHSLERYPSASRRRWQSEFIF
jgi:hypothetical protein